MNKVQNPFRSPLFHFLILGAILFAMNYWLNPEYESGSEIILQNEELNVFAEMAKNNGVLDTSIFRTLVNKKVDQELVFQYGVNLKLHESNSNLKEQIVLAAQELIMAQALLSDPGDSVLNNYLLKNIDRIGSKEFYDFDQYLFKTELEAQQALFTINTGNTIENGKSETLPVTLILVSSDIIKQWFGALFKFFSTDQY